MPPMPARPWREWVMGVREQYIENLGEQGRRKEGCVSKLLQAESDWQSYRHCVSAISEALLSNTMRRTLSHLFLTRPHSCAHVPCI
jgi:hypothetical protein